MLSKTLGLFLPTNSRQLNLMFGLVAAVVIISLAGATPALAQRTSLPLYTITGVSGQFGSPDDSLRTIDPLTGETLTTTPITLAGQTVNGGTGLAMHPTTGQLFAVLNLDAVAGRVLVTIDPATGVATSIGNTGLRIANIAFSDDGTLWGVTGDQQGGGATNPATLFTIDTATAIPTLRLALGTEAADGEAIGFNPGDGMLYHVSSNVTFEPIDITDPTAPVVGANTGFSLDVPGEVLAITHWSGDMFLVTDLNDNLFIVRPNGESRFLSTVDHFAKGVVFAGAAPACPQVLYGSAHNGQDGPSLLYSINQASGVATLVGPTGFERTSGMDFLSTGALIATGERQDGSDNRVLIEIDPCTGLGTEIGPTGLSQIMDMSARSDDVVVGVSGFSNLASFNTSTGAGANIAALTPDCSTSGGCGLAYDAADNLIFNNDRDPVTLVTVDDTTGVGTPLITLVPPPAIDTNLPRLNAMDFNPSTDTLFGSWIDDFGSNSLHYLVTVDTATGDVVSLGETQSNLDAIAFLPGTFVTDLAITKTISIASPVVGVNFTYTVTVTNNGPGDATGVTVVDTLPSPSFTTVSITPNKGTCSGSGTVTCTIGTLAAVDDPATTTVVENVATITIVGRATAAVALTNTATVTGNETDPDSTNNTAVSSTSSIVPQYTVTLSPTSGSTSSGGTVTFTVTVTTTGAPILAPITLNCLVLNGSVVITCSFNPTTVIPGGTSANSTLTVTAVTTTGTASLGMPPGQQPGAPLFAVWLGLPLLAFLTTLGFGGGKKRLVFALAMALLVLSLLPMAGCNNNDVQPAPGPQTVTFVARGVIATTTVNSNSATLTVTP